MIEIGGVQMIDFSGSAKRVRELERRLEWLDTRIGGWSGSPGGLRSVRAERSALAWAIEIVKDVLSHHEAAKGDGPYDSDELVRWADLYGHPEDWARRAQQAHWRAERLAAELEQRAGGPA